MHFPDKALIVAPYVDDDDTIPSHKLHQHAKDRAGLAGTRSADDQSGIRDFVMSPYEFAAIVSQRAKADSRSAGRRVREDRRERIVIVWVALRPAKLCLKYASGDRGGFRASPSHSQHVFNVRTVSPEAPSIFSELVVNHEFSLSS